MPDLDLPDRAVCDVCSGEYPVTKTGTLRKHKCDGGDGIKMPCPGGGRPVGPARIPRRSTAGFYKCHTTGAMLRSVTTILGQGSPKPALVHWAGNLVAETAMESLPRLVKASRREETRVEAYDWLRRAHTRKKDERAEVGSAVHALIEAHVLGEPVPEQLLTDPETAPYLEHFRRFVDDFEVTFEASEMVVASYTESYAGTLDYLLRSPHIAGGALLMGDTKTGGELDVKGVYPEAGVQMSAYAHAEYGWLRDGTRVPFPADEVHDVGVVLHLRPEGYRLIPVKCGPEVFEAFRHIRHVADFNADLSPHLVGDALPVPTHTTTRKAA
ncbi:hypothetical protein ACOQFV_27475 [Nocardiopsis changdeensis]|uniref:DUF2800 domain-containing protein n=1 Tax=Nocardiopsis changdeensis TaxID=2831969 RepID=A0ABX8BX19_9ACTN|nr:hypothetical protein [Nocardiopsis sp. MT53]QUX25672.1 hypothetical protein KGD84_00935 [Nocardiopsis changdeensis]QYX38952.1 hypothetical protein K1J57_10385 [Nocardiopsis sp. MT53]